MAVFPDRADGKVLQVVEAAVRERLQVERDCRPARGVRLRQRDDAVALRLERRDRYGRLLAEAHGEPAGVARDCDCVELRGDEDGEAALLRRPGDRTERIDRLRALEFRGGHRDDAGDVRIVGEEPSREPVPACRAEHADVGGEVAGFDVAHFGDGTDAERRELLLQVERIAERAGSCGRRILDDVSAARGKARERRIRRRELRLDPGEDDRLVVVQAEVVARNELLLEDAVGAYVRERESGLGGAVRAERARVPEPRRIREEAGDARLFAADAGREEVRDGVDPLDRARQDLPRRGRAGTRVGERVRRTAGLEPHRRPFPEVAHRNPLGGAVPEGGFERTRPVAGPHEVELARDERLALGERPVECDAPEPVRHRRAGRIRVGERDALRRALGVFVGVAARADGDDVHLAGDVVEADRVPRSAPAVVVCLDEHRHAGLDLAQLAAEVPREFARQALALFLRHGRIHVRRLVHDLVGPRADAELAVELRVVDEHVDDRLPSPGVREVEGKVERPAGLRREESVGVDLVGDALARLGKRMRTRRVEIYVNRHVAKRTGRFQKTAPRLLGVVEVAAKNIDFARRIVPAVFLREAHQLGERILWAQSLAAVGHEREVACREREEVDGVKPHPPELVDRVRLSVEPFVAGMFRCGLGHLLAPLVRIGKTQPLPRR